VAWLKEASRFGPQLDGPLKKVRTGYMRRTEEGVHSIDIAKSDEHTFTKRSSISPLADIVLGKGSAYNPANTFGEPYWWQDDSLAVQFGGVPRRVKGKVVLGEPKPPFQFGAPAWWLNDPRANYRGEERRWVLYSLGFRRRSWSEQQGRAAEARGIEIAANLSSESQDVRRVAAWLRDGWTRVPPRSVRHITRERVEVAMLRLKDLGLLRKIGKAFRIQ
jgi:hypothetical protein